jgi:hypothetical protein
VIENVRLIAGCGGTVCVFIQVIESEQLLFLFLCKMIDSKRFDWICRKNERPDGAWQPGLLFSISILADLEKLSARKGRAQGSGVGNCGQLRG